MSIKSIFILGSTVLGSVVFAQAVLGTVGNVQGLVTDTDGATVSSTVLGEQITDGKRFVSSSNGFVTLKLNNDCEIKLTPNQAVTIDSKMTCRQLIAAVTSVGPPGLVLAGGNAARGLFAVGALAAGGFALDRVIDKNPNVSGR